MFPKAHFSLSSWAACLILAFAGLAAAPAQADPVLIDNFIGGNDHGFGDVIEGQGQTDFNIEQAQASYDGSQITVTITTNYANTLQPFEDTNFGDLFLSPTWVDGARGSSANGWSNVTYQQGDWAYAVHIANPDAAGGGSAALYQLPASGTDPVIQSNVGALCPGYTAPGSGCGWIWRDGEPVQVNPTGLTAIGAASWSVTPGQAVGSEPNVTPGTISFSFLPPPSLLTFSNGTVTGFNFALSWAMTCANDIIQGPVSGPVTPEHGPPTPLPEPGSLVVMLSALGFMSFMCRPRNSPSRISPSRISPSRISGRSAGSR